MRKERKGFSYQGTAHTVTTAGRRLDATQEVTPSHHGREEKLSNPNPNPK